MAPWDAAGGGGSMLGGVERGCVFTSAGESGIVPVSSFLSTAGAVVGETKRGRVKQADGTRGTHAGCGRHCWFPGGRPTLRAARPNPRPQWAADKPQLCSQGLASHPLGSGGLEGGTGRIRGRRNGTAVLRGLFLGGLGWTPL